MEKAQRTVILKHMFQPQELENDPGLIMDLKEDVREECEKLDEVKNVMVYDVGGGRGKGRGVRSSSGDGCGCCCCRRCNHVTPARNTRMA